MVVAIILIAWVCFSTILCLALLGAAAKSIPQSEQQSVPENELRVGPEKELHVVPEKEVPSNLRASPPRAAHGSRFASSLSS